MPSVLEVDVAAHGETVVLEPGQALVIRLGENPSTAYRWTVEVSDGLQLESDSFTLDDAGIGAGGQRRMTLHATAPGKHRLVLLQRREWQPPASALARFELTVIASP